MKNTNQTGFSIIEVLLVLVIAGGLAFTGWFIHHSQQVADKTLTSNNSTMPAYKKKTVKNMVTADPYSGWKSYTTKYDKLSFKYPSSWKLTDQSSTNNTDVTPGSDGITLVSNDSLEVIIGTGDTTFTGWSGDQKPVVLAATPVKMLGGTYYLNFDGASGTTITGGANVTKNNAFPSSFNLPASRNIHFSKRSVYNAPGSGQPAPFDIIGIDYSKIQGSADNSTTLSTFQQDPNYKTGMLILESMAY